MGEEEKALAAFDQAIAKAAESDSETGNLFQSRAKLKARLLDFEGALEDLKQALEEVAFLRQQQPENESLLEQQARLSRPR